MTVTQMILSVAATYNLNAAELYGLIMVESSGCKNIVSTESSALGCGQITKATAKDYDIDHNQLYDHYYSIHSTGRILESLQKRFPRSYLCAYNKGPAGVKKYWHTDCKDYISKVKQYKKEFKYDINRSR